MSTNSSNLTISTKYNKQLITKYTKVRIPETVFNRYKIYQYFQLRNQVHLLKKAVLAEQRKTAELPVSFETYI